MSDAQTCPSDRLQPVVAALRSGDSAALSSLDALVRDYPLDPQLHFLRGSVLAQEQRFAEAREAMQTAVDLAPGYALARFQLGLLELTSAMPAAAEATWAPLETLPAAAPLRLFATGLRHLIRDEFDAAVGALREGIRRNTEIPAMNADMRLIITKIEARDEAPTDEPVSATHLLLQQYSTKGN